MEQLKAQWKLIVGAIAGVALAAALQFANSKGIAIPCPSAVIQADGASK